MNWASSEYLEAKQNPLTIQRFWVQDCQSSSMGLKQGEIRAFKGVICSEGQRMKELDYQGENGLRVRG